MDDAEAAAAWPAEDMEELGRCPICGSSDRQAAYEGLIDRIFGAPGRWRLYRCSCSVVYLDPRPSEASIHRAYASYHTHHVVELALPWRTAGLGGAVRRGYLNGKYRYRMPEASLLGRLTWRFRRRAVRNLDFVIRHLGPPARSGARILDVGCGNGDFLKVAEDLGYSAVGIDPDVSAVALGRARGLDIRAGSLPGSNQPPGSFDHIFLSHVLEHLHHPRAALEEILALLAPGGRLWLSQPNLDAPGLARFGKDWRGLEPPRHLSLYNAVSLASLLTSVGFAEVSLLPAEEAALFYYRQSHSVKLGLNPYDGAEPPGWKEEVMPAALAANRLARSRPDRGESLSMQAFKPS